MSIYVLTFINFTFFQTAIDKYRAGYADCAREVARYLSTPEPPPLPSVPSLADQGCKTRLLRHLDQCIAEIDTEICPNIPSKPTTATTPNVLLSPTKSNSNGNGTNDKLKYDFLSTY